MIINNAALTGSFTVNGVNYITNTPTTGSNTYVGTQTTSGSVRITGSLQVTGSVSTTGTITAQTLVVQTVTSSIVYSSGSNIFGNSSTDTQKFTGSVLITGSLALAGNITSNGTAVVLGTGTTNTLPKFTGTSTIGNSIISESGSAITVAGSVEVGAGTYSSGLAKLYTSSVYGTILTGKSGSSSDMLLTDRSGNIAFQILANGSTPNVVIGNNLGSDSVSVNGIATSANYKLGVTSSAFISGTNSKGVFITDQSTYASIVGINSAISTYNSLEIRASGIDGQLFIHTNGNVGIGTTSPSTKLTVYGSSSAISGTNDAIRLQVASYDNGGRNTIAWHQDAGNLNLGRFGIEWNNSSSQMNFVWRDLYNSAAGTTELMRLTGAGNLGIGRTPTTNILEINGDASKTSAGSWLANSDINIKTNINTIQGALERINKLRLVSFKYKDEYKEVYTSIKDKYYQNVIAQEYQEIYPDYVYDSGEIFEEHNILQVDTNPMFVDSVSAIQELSKIVQEQQAQIEELKALIAAK